MPRLKPYLRPGCLEAGCDEAGRGCLAGPVCCAAVILPPGFDPEGIDDSKKLSPTKREKLRHRIETTALCWAVTMVQPDEIDRINILNASLQGMQQAANLLHHRPESILFDGNRTIPVVNGTATLAVQATPVVGGDAKFLSIAAASILAKTHRDEYMKKLALQYPGYGWETNMGYPTAQHYEAIRRLGPTPHHRRTFRLYKEK